MTADVGEGVRERKRRKEGWQTEWGGTRRRRREIEDDMKPIPDSLAFTCDKAFSLFSPPFLANLYICLSFPPSVKVSTQCTAVFCLWKHS